MATTITSSAPGGSLPAFDPSLPPPPGGCPPPGQATDFADSLQVESAEAAEQRTSLDLMTLFGMILKRKSDEDKDAAIVSASTFQAAPKVCG